MNILLNKEGQPVADRGNISFKVMVSAWQYTESKLGYKQETNTRDVELRRVTRAWATGNTFQGTPYVFKAVQSLK